MCFVILANLTRSVKTPLTTPAIQTLYAFDLIFGRVVHASRSKLRLHVAYL